MVSYNKTLPIRSDVGKHLSQYNSRESKSPIVCWDVSPHAQIIYPMNNNMMYIKLCAQHGFAV